MILRDFLTAIIVGLACLASPAFCQEDDLLSLLGDNEETTNYVTASFKTNRVINLHSLESTAGGVLDIKISHRFGTLNRGAYELFGLDNASIRIGGDYGITDLLTVGIGRSSFEKTLRRLSEIQISPAKHRQAKYAHYGRGIWQHCH